MAFLLRSSTIFLKYSAVLPLLVVGRDHVAEPDHDRVGGLRRAGPQARREQQ
jgi:hypothetical protein